MIRKPADSQPLDERAAVRMVRTAAAFATQARRGGVAAAGLFVYALAIFLGIMAIANGLATSWALLASSQWRRASTGSGAGSLRRRPQPGIDGSGGFPSGSVIEHKRLQSQTLPSCALPSGIPNPARCVSTNCANWWRSLSGGTATIRSSSPSEMMPCTAENIMRASSATSSGFR